MEEKIIALITRILEVEEGTITANTKMEDVEQWDSLAHVMIIGALEEELGIEIAIDEAADMTGVDDILRAASV